MRHWLSIYSFLFFGLFAQAQVDTVFLETDSAVGSVGLHANTWFFIGEGLPRIDRVAAFQPEGEGQEFYFYLVIVWSIVFAVVFVSSKEIVFSSWRSFFRVQNQIQYNRSDKSGSLIYLLLYAILFILVFSVLMSYVMQTFWTFNTGLWQISLVCFLYFAWDYLSANLYHLFAGNRKAIDAVKYIGLSYAPLWSILVWIGLFFVLFASRMISGYTAAVLLSFIGISIVIKELRVLQILWGEKVDIMSFHFFAYLCTFKFLPFVLFVLLIF
jgi:hypothetical protein